MRITDLDNLLEFVAEPVDDTGSVAANDQQTVTAPLEPQLQAPAEPQPQAPAEPQPQAPTNPPAQQEQNTTLLNTIGNELAGIEHTSEESPQFAKIALKKINQLVDYVSSIMNTSSAPIREESQSEIAASISILEDQLAHLIGEPKFELVVSTIRNEIQKLYQKITEFVKKERVAGGEEVKEKFAISEKQRLEYASSIATRVGKSEEWAANLVGAVSGLGNTLSSKFLQACATGTAMTMPISKLNKVDKKRLPSLVSADLKELFEPEYRKVLTRLIKLPFTETTGFGGGVAPGESLLACLIPGAISAEPKGDLHIDGENWEVKAGSYGDSPSKRSFAYLDAQSVTPGELKTVFIDACKEALKGSKIGINKSVKIGDSTYTMMDLIKLSDFRSNKLSILKAVLDKMQPQQRTAVLGAVYARMAPTVGAKRPAEFSNAVSKSLVAIDAKNIEGLALIQTKLSMLEYGINDYQSPNFIFFNSTTLDVMFMRGTGSINNALSSKYNVVVQTMTMGGGAKASPGVFLAGDNEQEVEKIIGFVRKRPKVARSKALKEALQEVDNLLLNHFK